MENKLQSFDSRTSKQANEQASQQAMKQTNKQACPKTTRHSAPASYLFHPCAAWHTHIHTRKSKHELSGYTNATLWYRHRLPVFCLFHYFYDCFHHRSYRYYLPWAVAVSSPGGKTNVGEPKEFQYKFSHSTHIMLYTPSRSLHKLTVPGV